VRRKIKGYYNIFDDNIYTKKYKYLFPSISACEIILRTLIALVANGQVVKDLLEYGGLVYILAIFGECANINNPSQDKQGGLKMF
jgi:hypothetical protein